MLWVLLVCLILLSIGRMCVGVLLCSGLFIVLIVFDSVVVIFVLVEVIICVVNVEVFMLCLVVDI